ncbi:hypothetical protein CEXT_554401 [Caerostris extrusa]|uniref:Uncharacterized protein n=1 Tax=Caerostris extrusa TaxID=172846 RepID=A0AAV4NNA4_CAEEX|nr:hypothetical protein CEXT_554401 [Caerostris extrusa]
MDMTVHTSMHQSPSPPTVSCGSLVMYRKTKRTDLLFVTPFQIDFFQIGVAGLHFVFQIIEFLSSVFVKYFKTDASMGWVRSTLILYGGMAFCLAVDGRKDNAKPPDVTFGEFNLSICGNRLANSTDFLPIQNILDLGSLESVVVGLEQQLWYVCFLG